MRRKPPPGALVSVVLALRRWHGVRLLESGARPRVRGGAAVRVDDGGGRAARGDLEGVARREPGQGRVERGEVGPVRGSRDAVASPPRGERGERGERARGERSRGPGTTVDWVARFEDELGRIATVEASGPPPRVAHSDAVPNVGANGAVVLVNAQWMQAVSDEICGDRAACRRDLVRGIAGHEWSHVVDARRGRTSGEPDHDKELQADRTAGRILAQSGASTRPLLDLLAGDRSGPSLTHPSGGDRVEAVLAGQQDAGGGCRGEGTCRCCDPCEAEA